mgnify:CR=1 FL=1
MHLLVLSAFRLTEDVFVVKGVTVSMHLLVLSAFRRRAEGQLTHGALSLNAPFGAQCFPTWRIWTSSCLISVSMHLLVLSAFRLITFHDEYWRVNVSMHLLVLSAFRLDHLDDARRFLEVSMHLLVLSAFRLEGEDIGFIYEVSMHLLVLSAFRPPPPESRVATPFPGTKTPPTWKAPNRIGSHRSN